LEPLTRTAIYCRVSTEEQAREGFSIAAQKKTLESFCQIKGWNIVKEYVDEGISGKTTRRPAFQQLLCDLRCGKFDAVIVWKINRLSRKNADLLNTAETLREHGVSLLSFSEQFDSSTPSGKLDQALILSMIEMVVNGVSTRKVTQPNICRLSICTSS
jgi:site-specific DNA recombinase